MIKRWRCLMWLAGIAGSVGLSAAAVAQSSAFQPLKGIFGTKTAVEQKSLNGNRMAEIQVELAWLSDRITFPYYLEAHLKGSNLEVRGYVPTKTVREQAINLAKLNCPLPVIDALKEHPSLGVRQVRRAPDQLKSSVQTALRETFPGLQLDVHCLSDGTVQISGAVRSFEQKLAISTSLRRLHGCMNVVNFTEVGSGDASGQHATPFAGATGQPRNPAPVTNEPYESRGVVVVSTEQPTASRGVVVVSTDKQIIFPAAPAPAPTVPAPKAAAAEPLTATQLKNLIEATIPGACDVVVTFRSKSDVRIECAIRAGDDSRPIAGQILSLRELDPYKVDLQIQLPTPDPR
jgi:hypothetical protein